MGVCSGTVWQFCFFQGGRTPSTTGSTKRRPPIGATSLCLRGFCLRMLSVVKGNDAGLKGLRTEKVQLKPMLRLQGFE